MRSQEIIVLSFRRWQAELIDMRLDQIGKNQMREQR